MDAPIDLAAIRAAHDERLNGPDAEHVCIIVKNGKAEKWFKFSVVFKIDDTEFTFNIWALDAADAERRVSAIKATAVLGGQVMAAIPL